MPSKLAVTDPTPSALKFYHSSCHISSPTYRQWVPLSAFDIHHKLTRPVHSGSGRSATQPYYFLNHPIRFVCVAGVVVGVSEVFVGRWVLDLDDSSGAGLKVVVDLQWPRSEVGEQLAQDRGTSKAEADKKGEAEPLIDRVKKLGVGDVVRINGTIETFRGTRQVLVETLAVLKETNEEVRFWEARRKVKIRVLMRPWVLGEDEVKKLRKEEDERVAAERQAGERQREWEREREQWDERLRLKIERNWERDEALRKEAAEVARAQGLEVNQRPRAGVV